MKRILAGAAAAALDDTATAHLRDGMTARDAVETLLAAGLPACALRLQVHLMPQGYVLPWVCGCVRHGDLPEDEARGFRLAERWMRKRDDESRKAALVHAEASGFADAGALVSACAGWSEGHLTDGHGNDIPVGPHMVPAAAAGALLMLAARRDGGSMNDACAGFVRDGMEFLAPERHR